MSMIRSIIMSIVNDIIFIKVGALGWITGQSYQIAAVLASGITSAHARLTRAIIYQLS